MPDGTNKLKSAMEILNLYPPLLREAFNVSEGQVDSMYPDLQTEIDASVFDDLSGLRSEFQRLTTPRREYAPIGGHIPGNEFSLSLRGLSQGINDMAASVDAKRRQQRLFGDPERRDEIQSQINEIEEEANSLRATAEQTLGGIETGEAYFARSMPEVREEMTALAEQNMAKADELDAEAEVLREQLRQYSGVAAQLDTAEREAAMHEADVERDRTFRDNFIQTFGQAVYNSAVQTMGQRASFDHAENMEKIRTESWKERQRWALKNRPPMPTAAEGTVMEERGVPNYANVRWVGDYLKGYHSDVEGELEYFKELLAQKHPTLTRRRADRTLTFDMERIDELPAEDRNTLNKLRMEIDYLDDIDLARSFWADPNFEIEQMPPVRHPTHQEKARLRSMREIGIPEDLIKAYKWYRQIDPRMPPPDAADRGDTLEDRSFFDSLFPSRQAAQRETVPAGRGVLRTEEQ